MGAPAGPGAELGLRQVLEGRALEGLAALEGAMDARTAAAWVPLLKKALDHLSRRGNGPSASPDEALRRALGKAIGLVPADWELLCLRGTLLAGRSDFEPALKDFEKAIALAPGSPKPRADRAYLHSRLGDWNAALADLDRAQALAGGGSALAFERGLVLLSLGRAPEARAELVKAAAGSRDAETGFQLGRCLLIEGRFEEALARIRAALQQDGGRSDRGRYYSMTESLALALPHLEKPGGPKAPEEDFMKDARKTAAKDGKGCLWLLGVGIDRPYEITLNTIMAMRRCDTVFTQADTREVRELLEVLFPGVRSIANNAGASPRRADVQDQVWKSVSAELDLGRQTGYVTYGHPLLFGEGNMMARRCKAAGYPYRVLTAPSSIDGILTMLQDDLELCEKGFQVQNARNFTLPGERFETGSGSIILGINRLFEENTFGVFCDRLEAAFPKSHPVYGLKCPDGYREEVRVPMTVGEFRRKERDLDPALSLFLPELKSAAPPTKPAAKPRARKA